MTAQELIELGNRRVIEICGARYGLTDGGWHEWMRKNGWRYESTGAGCGDLWSHKEFIGWNSDSSVFEVEIKRALFEPQKLVKTPAVPLQANPEPQ